MKKTENWIDICLILSGFIGLISFLFDIKNIYTSMATLLFWFSFLVKMIIKHKKRELK